jgi:hypothetical protein
LGAEKVVDVQQRTGLGPIRSEGWSDETRIADAASSRGGAKTFQTE